MASNAEPRKKGRSTKNKIGLGIAIIVVIFGILLLLAKVSPSQNNSGTDQTSLVHDVQNASTTMLTKPISAILPVRDDLGTEWKILPAQNDPKLFYQYQVPVQGFREGVEQSFNKVEGLSGYVLRVTAYTFGSTDMAAESYNSIVSKLREIGGYKEINTDGINAKCYGTSSSDAYYEYVSLLCIKENIFFRVHEVGGAVDMDNLTHIANAVANKID